MKYVRMGGFTMIELVMVIAILGILSVAAIPSFINITDEAKGVTLEAVVGNIQEGIDLYSANNYVTNFVYEGPGGLGSAGAGNFCTEGDGCFGEVLDRPIKTDRWKHVSHADTAEQWNYYPDPGNLAVAKIYFYERLTRRFFYWGDL